MTESGVEASMSRSELMAQKNMNLVFWCATGTVWSYVPIDLYAADYPLLVLNFLTGVGYLFGFYLIGHGHKNAGKIWGYYNAAITIYLTGDRLGDFALVHFYNLIAAVLPFLTFAKKDSKSMWIATAGGIIGWFAAYILPEHLVMGAATHPEYYTKWVPIFITPVFIIAVMAQTYSLFQYLLELSEKQQMQLVNTHRMTALGEMAGGVAHEINNPLAIISAATTIVRREVAEPQKLSQEAVNKRLDTIDRTIERISKITTGLLNFSQFEYKEEDLRKPISVKSILESITANSAEKIRKRGVDVQFQMPGDLNVKIDEVHLSQIITNLTNNSLDAVETLDERWVRINCEIGDEYFEIQVTDSGHGVPAQVASRMMEPFFTTKPVGSGVGLGLSISKGFIEGYGGRLLYEEYEGHTRFSARFPANLLEGRAV